MHMHYTLSTGCLGNASAPAPVNLQIEYIICVSRHSYRYRAKVERTEGSKCHVLYVDFGNVSDTLIIVPYECVLSFVEYNFTPMACTINWVILM